jgi:response regulator RpfG family c-di-GMP phosphodiesterase
MDGFELYDKIKKVDKNVKVFFISAFEIDHAAIRKQYPTLKIENFIPKPILIPELIKKINEKIWYNNQVLLTYLNWDHSFFGDRMTYSLPEKAGKLT